MCHAQHAQQTRQQAHKGRAMSAHGHIFRALNSEHEH
jgi:hypothetical protein